MVTARAENRQQSPDRTGHAQYGYRSCGALHLGYLELWGRSRAPSAGIRLKSGALRRLAPMEHIEDCLCTTLRNSAGFGGRS